MKLRSFARGATVVANVLAIIACGNREVGTEAGNAELVVGVLQPPPHVVQNLLGGLALVELPVPGVQAAPGLPVALLQVAHLDVVGHGHMMPGRHPGRLTSPGGITNVNTIQF